MTYPLLGKKRVLLGKDKRKGPKGKVTPLHPSPFLITWWPCKFFTMKILRTLLIEVCGFCPIHRYRTLKHWCQSGQQITSLFWHLSETLTLSHKLEIPQQLAWWVTVLMQEHLSAKLFYPQIYFFHHNCLVLVSQPAPLRLLFRETLLKIADGWKLCKYFWSNKQNIHNNLHHL